MSSEASKILGRETVIGHPAGLFILFFTEMWERFSYYGMRALLVLFLVSSIGLGGWEWSNAEALSLYGTYTGLVYITPILGGFLADRFFGFKNAVILGAVLMTAGHASMAFETEATFYIGLGLLILGNGFFKPNISSIVGGLYKDEKKKDAGYTIFYMGINAGAFLGILLCGYIGEKVGWSYGFGLAGVFMFIGMLQFIFAKKIFGGIGDKPSKSKGEGKDNQSDIKEEYLLGVFQKTNGKGETNASEENSAYQDFKSRFIKKIRRDRLWVIIILAVFTIFFWMAFEQAGGSMTLFAKDYTNRILTGSAATTFSIVNTVITIVPLAIITWVLFKLFKATFKNYALSNLFLGLGFVAIWGIAIWMINKDFNTKAYVVEFEQFDANTNQTISSSTTIRTDSDLDEGNDVAIIDLDGEGTYRYLTPEKAEQVRQKLPATVTEIKDKEVEVAASWFGVLNSLFIILFAPVFSKIWESKFNPSAPIKFALGLILLGLGFGVLAFGASGIQKGVMSASVSMIWLILAYLFHTLGELALSPVGLSYVSKLSPPKLVSMMFGLWFGATAIANYLAGASGSLIDKITKASSISTFFLIFTFIPIGAGVILMLLNKLLVKKMHGIK